MNRHVPVELREEIVLTAQEKRFVDNSLAILFPQLAKEWHPTKNGLLTPDDVIAGSSKKA